MSVKPIFYFEKVTSFDKWSMGIYIVFTFGSLYFFSEKEMIPKTDIIFFYGLGTQLCIYGFLYKSLRNLSAYMFWICIGIFHLYLYSILKGDPTLEMFRGHSSTPLRNTIPLLVLYQVLRFLSLKIQGQELVCPSRGASTDLFDERKVNWLDFTFFVIYIASVIAFDT